ncbi:AfsA-related hotdog domain-containing protein [Streptomyces violaceusniger]|uniref:A-factor biosynthesis hotdog domain-containing protein n=1 Tax=Streptomyces violaceusniger (strain Tu 4113) TaxID=653045 RepID=G2PHK3_STRV4|nr:AfsA-related hotdog domain-containing protein [Streptomyces violaceusniger]AEM89006.1 hypothetical protein Strvi_0233 [Streptomyces violaceusniger Tu 4113]
MPSDPQSLWLIGESFHRATVHPQFVTQDQLLTRLRTEQPPVPLIVRPGLGIDPVSWHDLRMILGKEIDVTFEGEPPLAVPRRHVLKHCVDNVVIGDAAVDGNAFRAQLVVPNDTEMLRDHSADQQHVPGLLLIEAATQIVTWAAAQLTEPLPGQPPRYAVMHACDFDFRRFVFPLPATLTGTLEIDGEPQKERIPLRSTVTVTQNGRVCSRLGLRLHAFDRTCIFAVEHSQALATLADASGIPGESA